MERKPLVTVDEFKEMVDRNPWFVQALRDDTIDYWNFNCCLYPDREPRYAWRSKDDALAEKMGFCKIDEYKGISFGKFCLKEVPYDSD